MSSYAISPPLAPARAQQVLETLAIWLASGRECALLQAWDAADWQYVEWVAYWQGASALLAQRLAAAGVQPPAAVAARLDAVAADIRLNTTAMLASAAELLAALELRAIPAIPLKGAVLAPRYYAEPEVRALGDLDILIRPMDMPAVQQVLVSLGYRFSKRTEKEDTYRRGESRENRWAPDKGSKVEVQHRVLSEYASVLVDLTDLVWQRSPVQPYQGDFACRQPDPVVLLVHVSVHALADWVLGRGNLLQINDLVQLVDRMTAQGWHDLTSLAAGQERFVYPPLLLLERLAPGRLPAALASSMSAALPARLADWCRSAALGPLFELTNVRPKRRDYSQGVADLFLRGPRDAWGAYVRLLFPPRWHSRLEAYPDLVGSPFWPLAYVPLNLRRLWRAGRRGSALLRGEPRASR